MFEYFIVSANSISNLEEKTQKLIAGKQMRQVIRELTVTPFITDKPGVVDRYNNSIVIKREY